MVKESHCWEKNFTELYKAPKIQYFNNSSKLTWFNENALFKQISAFFGLKMFFFEDLWQNYFNSLEKKKTGRRVTEPFKILTSLFFWSLPIYCHSLVNNLYSRISETFYFRGGAVTLTFKILVDFRKSNVPTEKKKKHAATKLIFLRS